MTGFRVRELILMHLTQFHTAGNSRLGRLFPLLVKTDHSLLCWMRFVVMVTIVCVLLVLRYPWALH